MIRDILNAIQAAVAQAQPPTVGPPTVTPASTNTGSGVVSCDTSTKIFGTYNVLLVVTTPGAPGTAQAKLSLDNGGNVGNPNSQGNFSAPFTLPASTPGYAVPLPSLSPLLGSPGPSGLVLDFSGSFNVGDTFSFQALPQITFLAGDEELDGQDTLFPRVVFALGPDEFQGAEDFAEGADQRTQSRFLLTDVAHFEAHCWGQDYDRTEVLRDTVINGIHFAVQATKVIRGGHWENVRKLNKAGALYVLQFSVKKPVLQLQQDTEGDPPPFSLNLSTAWSDTL